MYQSVVIKDVYKTQYQKLEAFIGKPATAALFTEDGALIQIISGEAEAITVIEGGHIYGVDQTVEAVKFKGSDTPLATAAKKGSYIILSGELA